MGRRRNIIELAFAVYDRLFGFRKVYNDYIRDKEPNGSLLLEQSKEIFSYNPKYSVVIPLYKTPVQYLEELLQSFLNQTYKNFEICFSDASPENEKVIIKGICDKYSELGLLINYIPLEKNLGISENTNKAIEISTGDFVVFCDHDDTVAFNTFYAITRALNNDPTIDGFYSEQDYLTANGKNRLMPIFKPDLDMELIRNCNYITHIFVVRKTIIDAVGMLNPKMDGSQDYDFILRVLEYTKNIYHIPEVLYHWRLSDNSTSANPEAKVYAYDAGKEAISAHLKRQSIDFEKIEYLSEIGRYHTTYVIKGEPLVSVIVSSEYENLKDILKSQDYKNYEIVNSPREAKGEYLLFLDKWICPENESFIRELLYFAEREEVGAVSSRIDYKNGKIFSAGKVLGKGGFIGESLLGCNLKSNEGLWWGHSVRNVSAAGFWALMTRRDLYLSNIPDEKMGDFKDIDYSLSLRKQGKSILVNPFSKAIYIGKNNLKEKSSGKEELLLKWDSVFKTPDPFYNINFKVNRANYNL